jgi:AP-1 complex subunit mu
LACARARPSSFSLQVRYLKVSEKSGYQALPWVRYISKSANDYDFRV